MKAKALFILCSLLLTGCSIITTVQTDPTLPAVPTPEPTMATLPNPASAYCQQLGYTSEIRTASDGSQTGMCIFPDGSECDEWAYYRGECSPTSSDDSLANPASAYCRQQGNTSEIRTASNGSQSGICIFSDGSECDEWAYYRGECSPAGQGDPQPDPGAAFCEMLGYTVKMRTAADGNQVAMCQFPDGSECNSTAFLKGECIPLSQLSSLPNPSSVYCTQQGYALEIRTAADGSQSGACIFPDGSECDEWAYYRGECKPSDSISSKSTSEFDSQGWKIYRDEALGYSFHYPADAVISIDDNPNKSLSIIGTSLGSEFWGIAHPGDRQEYLPPENADLLQWLTDHNLLGENRQPDVQIAGITAIHFRHERSPQSYAFDQYFFAHAGQLFQISIGHSSDTEDWKLDNRFLQSFQFDQPSTPNGSSTPIPTAVPVDPSFYQGFWTYTHPRYGFSIMVPEDWVVEETTTFDPLMSGHTLILHPQPAPDAYPTLRVSFRTIGEEVLLWPTGVGAGEFISGGTLDVAGASARRTYFACPNGLIDSIWYQGSENQPNIQRGNMEFGFIFSYSGANCQEPYSLTGKVQLVGELSIASLQVPK